VRMLAGTITPENSAPRVAADFSDAKKFKGLCQSALLSLNVSQLVPRDYADPLQHAGASMEVYGVHCSPAILAAAWEHVLLYGDPNKIDARALGSDSPQREWAARKLERPAEAFLSKVQRAEVPAEREALVRMAQETIADENARFDRKIQLAQFITQHAPDMANVLTRLDEVMFEGKLGQGNGQSLQLVSEEECIAERNAMESRVWNAIGVTPAASTLSDERQVTGEKRSTGAAL